MILFIWLRFLEQNRATDEVPSNTGNSLTHDGSEWSGGGYLRGGEGEGVGGGGEDHSLRERSFRTSTEDPYPVTDVISAAIHS